MVWNGDWVETMKKLKALREYSSVSKTSESREWDLFLSNYLTREEASTPF